MSIFFSKFNDKNIEKYFTSFLYFLFYLFYGSAVTTELRETLHLNLKCMGPFTHSSNHQLGYHCWATREQLKGSSTFSSEQSHK
jgi:hypothetical protein